MSMSIEYVKKSILQAAPVTCLVIGSIVVIYASLWVRPISNIANEQITADSLGMLPQDMIPRSFLGTHKHLSYANVKDPFELSQLDTGAKAEELPQLKLTMIIINKRHKMCKVNGKLYTEGEKGPDFQVKYIGEEKVLIERQGRGQWLFLAQNS